MEANFGQLVRDIMKGDVITVSPEEGIQTIADTLMKRNIHAVPVVDSNRYVVGMITESDFFLRDRIPLHLPSFIDTIQKTLTEEILNDADRAIVEKIVSAQARDIMTTECVTVYGDTSLHDLLRIFLETHYKTIPVVDASHRLIGIVTLVDILKFVVSVNKTL
ncbi:MAG: CBS domain-containing protein [Candidatus Moraniibacteriota bacterium]